LSEIKIDGVLFKKMIISAANNLENNKVMVNALNVFPVPDGDTGTNMALTMMAAVKELNSLKEATPTIQQVADAAANGSLMGARGNSGVILSQIFRGFARALKGKENFDSKALAAAVMEGSNTAYKAIMKPTEGTILTVIRETGEHAVKAAENTDSVSALFEEIIEKANHVLDRTPEMLPILKNAGVVDAGGKGLTVILEGMFLSMKNGKILELKEKLVEEAEETTMDMTVFSEAELEFGYCTEFFIKASAPEVVLKKQLVQLGDSLVVVADENITKVHVHTNNPGRVLELAMAYGPLSKIKIDNMREQHSELYKKEIEKFNETEAATDPSFSEEPKPYGVVTIAMGEGISAIFKDLGADVVIEGGQTMNPSTEDIVNSIRKINAEHIVVLPNNSNIILAANQAKSLLTDKNIIVAPTKSIPQGISAMMCLEPERSPEENLKRIEKSISEVKTGLVTYAVRNTNFDGMEIEEGNIIGIVSGKIVEAGSDLQKVSKSVLKHMVDHDSSLVTVYYGEGTNEEKASELAEYVDGSFKDVESEVHYGGQPLYYYIMSVE